MKLGVGWTGNRDGFRVRRTVVGDCNQTLIGIRKLVEECIVLRGLVAEPETLVPLPPVVADQCFAWVVVAAFAAGRRLALAVRVMRKYDAVRAPFSTKHNGEKDGQNQP